MGNFIISDIEVEEILNRKLASVYINFRGIKMPVVAPISDSNPMRIRYESKRPPELHPKNGKIICNADINEFFQDLTEILFFLNNEDELNDFSIIKAAVVICSQHIKLKGKIIDNDLFSYIDLSIIAKNTIWSKLYNHPINQNEAEELWMDLKDNLIEVFKDNLYLTKYDFSDPMKPKPYLIKAY